MRSVDATTGAFYLEMISFRIAPGRMRARDDAVWRQRARVLQYALAFLWPLCGLLFLARTNLIQVSTTAANAKCCCC
jgi:phosphatidylserine synthase